MTREPWQAVNPGRWWIAGHEFVSIDPERIYHWRTKLSFARAYRRRGSLTYTTILPGEPETWDERLLHLPFEVYWKTFVKADARFYDVELERIDLKDNVFRIPYAEERTYFGFLTPETAG